MHELVAQLIDKAGLTQEQAEKSIVVVKEYIQSQLPPMMQGMVDNFLNQKNMSDIRMANTAKMNADMETAKASIESVLEVKAE